MFHCGMEAVSTMTESNPRIYAALNCVNLASRLEICLAKLAGGLQTSCSAREAGARLQVFVGRIDDDL